MCHGYWLSRIDHINGEKADNRLENLREATNAENLQNRGAPTNNSSGHKGVSWNKRDRRWTARIGAGGEKIHIGNFLSLEEAAAARAEVAKRLHGDFFKE